MSDQDGGAKVIFLFFATDYGTAVACRTDPVHTELRDYNQNSIYTYPYGEFPLELFDENCTYMIGGDNPGRLYCPGHEVACGWDPPDRDPAHEGGPVDASYSCGSNVRQKIFSCPW
jgi:hypothetical protein